MATESASDALNSTGGPAADAARQRARRRRRVLRYLAAVMATVGALVFFAFVTASANSAFFERNYTTLLWTNALLLVALASTVVILAYRLWQRWRARRFGARLMARVALMFALFGLLPGALIYGLSVQFLSRSLESWFNPRVDAALEAGVNLGRSALDMIKAEVSGKARVIARELSEVSPAVQGAMLNRLRDQAQLGEVTLLGANGKVIATAGGGISLLPDVPSAGGFSRLRGMRSLVEIEGDPSGDAQVGGELRVRAIVPVPRSSALTALDAEERYLQVVQPVPPQFAQNAQSVATVYQDYRQLSLARKGLRQIYAITLTMALLLAAFAALVAALLMATRFARPLLVLADGTRAVAEGDYRALPLPRTRDEIAELTQSFNLMTAQLAQARAEVLARGAELERANGYLSSVLANISTAVLVFDARMRLLTANAAAMRVLGDMAAPGSDLDALPAIGRVAADIRSLFDTQGLEPATASTWQHQFDIELGDGATLVLLARGSRLELTAGSGYVLVFDDISEVISAQRTIAWSEVARRLAHEIKNPLTPIQLSAERLAIKLAPKLEHDDAAILQRGTTTIVSQVAALKQMVDEFREYARMPVAKPEALDLNHLVEEVLGLYAGGEHGIVSDLKPDLPRIVGDATQLRQVIHNLLQNAQDAVSARLATGAQTPDAGEASIVVRTGALEYGATDTARVLARSCAVRLEVIDRGTGFSAKLLQRAFEPYVTTKARGTGLGLAIVRKIVEEHGARIDLQNAEGGGAVVGITFLRLA